MPKYFPFKVAGYYLYYTMECVIECMHVHASDARLTEGGSATEAIWRGRVKSSRVPLAALGTIFLSTLCNAEFSSRKLSDCGGPSAA